MADKTELRMNLAAIKRVDPYAKDIADSSAHVAFYTFNSDENEWEKTDVEGVFFIYSRNAEPFHSIFINNRLNTNSFVEPITGQLELQSQPPFLLYRNERSRIRGFWFYNSLECDRIGELVSRLIRESESKVKPITKNPDTIKSGLNNINIFTMLSKAQEDFNNAQYQPVVKQEIRANTTTSNNTNNPIDVASQSVMNFFAAAKPAAASEVPLFQRLLSNPVSVEQIEKQQRAATPQEGKISPPNVTAVNENGVSFRRVQSPKPSQDLNTSPLAKFLAAPNVQANSTKLIPTEPEFHHQKPLQQLLKKENNILIGGSPLQNNSGTKPALMPPTMFLSSSSSSLLGTTTTASEFGNKINAVSHRDSQHCSAFTKPEPLTQTQLLQAMMHLIQNDPEFIKKLHEAYLKSFTDMVSL